MKDRKMLNEILNNTINELNLNDKKADIKIKIKPLKRKIASISLINKTIYINKNILPYLSDEEIRFILAHELLHLKYGKYHINEFEEELLFLFPNKEAILMNLINKLYQKNTWKS
ncbi:M56 family metallopeptidase [Methanocaldococcus sp.]